MTTPTPSRPLRLAAGIWLGAFAAVLGGFAVVHATRAPIPWEPLLSEAGLAVLALGVWAGMVWGPRHLLARFLSAVGPLAIAASLALGLVGSTLGTAALGAGLLFALTLVFAVVGLVGGNLAELAAEDEPRTTTARLAMLVSGAVLGTAMVVLHIAGITGSAMLVAGSYVAILLVVFGALGALRRG